MAALNQRLPSWIGFGLEEHFRAEGMEHQSFQRSDDDNYLLNRWRFLMRIKPTSWLRIVGQMQDARAWLQQPPLQPPNTNRFDLKLAYAEFGNPEQHWISLRVGRQLINYNNTLIANSEWRNQARSYDAVVANLHYDRYRVGIFAASVVTPMDEGISHHVEGNNIFGMYGSIDSFIAPSSTLEPLCCGGVNDRPCKRTSLRSPLERSGLHNFDYSVEGIREGGSDGSKSINAWGTTDGLAYRFARCYWKPRMFSQYDYASGNKNADDGMHGAFDTMYPTAHDRFGISDQFGWQNIQAVRAGVTVEPHRRWTYRPMAGFLASQRHRLALQHFRWLHRPQHAGLRRQPHRAGSGRLHMVRDQPPREPGHRNRSHPSQATTSPMMEKGPSFTYPYFALNFKDAGKTH